jgi:hypothetical protein
MEQIKPTHLKTSIHSGGAIVLPSNALGKGKSCKNIDQVMRTPKMTKNKLKSKATSGKDAKAKNITCQNTSEKVQVIDNLMYEFLLHLNARSNHVLCICSWQLAYLSIFGPSLVLNRRKQIQFFVFINIDSIMSR